MKRGIIVGATLIAAATTSAAQVGTPDPGAAPSPSAASLVSRPLPTGSSGLRGQVVLADQSSQPVRRALVTLSSAELGYAQTAISDDAGRFAFVRLPAGRFTLTATRPAYLTTAYGSPQSGRPGTPITIATGQRLDDVTLRMARGAAISGVVRDDSGSPLAGLQVALLRATPVTTPPAAAAVETLMTDDRGEYRAFGLMPGSYLIVTSPRIFGSSEMQLRSDAEVDASLQELQRGGNRSQTPTNQSAGALAPPARSREAGPTTPRLTFAGYAPIFYDGATARADATPVTVAAGEDRRGVDIVARRVPTASVEGIVVNPNGPLPTVQMSLNPEGAATTGLGSLAIPAPALTIQPAAGGQFKFVGVPPGRHRLIARATGLAAVTGPDSFASLAPGRGGGGPTFWASADLTITGDDVSGVTLTLQPTMRLPGRVVFDAPSQASPPDPALVRVSLVSATQTGVTSMNGQIFGQLPIPPATAASDGSFAITGIIPGNYQLTAVAPAANLWLKSAMLGSRDLLDEPLIVTDPTDLGDVVVTFTERRTELSGTLQTSTGQPAPEYFILVFATDRAQWRPRARRLASARPGTDGRFILRDLPAGEYFLAALTDVDPDQWQSPAFLESVVGGAIRLAIADGEKKIQDIRFTR